MMRWLKLTLIFVLLAGAALSAFAAPRPAAPEPEADAFATDTASVLARSQVSYRAEGGFSGVESYGAIISCVNGEVSVMASIHDPRSKNGEPTRKICHITPERYVVLWNSLVRQAGLKLGDGPTLRRETLDEFSVTFILSVGDTSRQFRAQGLSLPECARYEALRSTIDEAAQMAEVWKAHDEALDLPKTDDSMVTFETLDTSLTLQP